MRMNIQGWDSLALDERPVTPMLKRRTIAILHARLGATRVKGVADFNMFWIKSGEAKAPPSRVLGVRKTGRTIHARAIIAVTARTQPARDAGYVRDMSRLTVEILTQIEAKTDVDLESARKTIARDFAKLLKPAKTATRKPSAK